jgi:hypothetical protein
MYIAALSLNPECTCEQAQGSLLKNEHVTLTPLSLETHVGEAIPQQPSPS